MLIPSASGTTAFHTFLVKPLENFTISYKVKHSLARWLRNHTLRDLSYRNEKLFSHTHIKKQQLYTSVHRSFVHNSPKLHFYFYLNRWIGKERGIFVPGMLLSKKRQTVDTCVTLENSQILCYWGKVNIKDLYTVKFNLYNILKLTKFKDKRTDQSWGKGMTIKE